MIMEYAKQVKRVAEDYMSFSSKLAIYEISDIFIEDIGKVLTYLKNDTTGEFSSLVRNFQEILRSSSWSINKIVAQKGSKEEVIQEWLERAGVPAREIQVMKDIFDGKRKMLLSAENQLEGYKNSYIEKEDPSSIKEKYQSRKYQEQLEKNLDFFFDHLRKKRIITGRTLIVDHYFDIWSLLKGPYNSIGDQLLSSKNNYPFDMIKIEYIDSKINRFLEKYCSRYTKVRYINGELHLTK